MTLEDPKDLAEYVYSHLLALKGLAERNDLEMLAWLLEVAALQALDDAKGESGRD